MVWFKHLHECRGCDSHTLLADSLGTGDLTLAEALLDQLANAARTGKRLSARELNSVLAIVSGITPRDPTEALLAAQMVAVHNATVSAACNLNHTGNIIQQDSASHMLNKLARTFAAQREALKRYRSTGEQSIRVQHVNVSANHAVAGISQGGGGTHEIESQSHAPSASGQPGPALLGHEQALPMPLQSAGNEGTVGMPHARRTRRGADGEA